MNPDRGLNPAITPSSPSYQPYVWSDNTSRAGHLQLYGISPTDGTTQTIEIDPGQPAVFYGTIYAPTAAMTVTGNPDIYGAIVCKSFSGNGNTSFHFDKALAGVGEPREYRLAHYIEDVR